MILISQLNKRIPKIIISNLTQFVNNEMCSFIYMDIDRISIHCEKAIIKGMICYLLGFPYYDSYNNSDTSDGF